MTNLHIAFPEEKLTEVYRLLLEMRDNCVKHADDQYDDPKREAKYEALNIAMNVMWRSIPPRWISVKERLPDKKEYVLCWYDDGLGKKWHTVGRMMDSVGNKWDLDVFHGYDEDGVTVTHWIPLPEPPKEATS